MTPPRRYLEAVVRDSDGRVIGRCLLRTGSYTIGQSEKNAIAIKNESVATLHARLQVREDGSLVIEELQGESPTAIGEKIIDGPTEIGVEARIQIGSTVMQFQKSGLPAEIFGHLPESFMRSSRYDMGEAIVEGSTSTIYDAYDTSLMRHVALKCMRPDSQAHPTHVLRFIREAQIASQLPHPGILPVYEMAQDEQGQLFYTTRFVEGESLSSILDDLAQASEENPPRHNLFSLLGIFRKVCDTLSYAHSRGVVHCGLRPECITVGSFGEVFVVNWGLAKVMDPTEERPNSLKVAPSNSLPANSAFTAPEQAAAISEDINAHTDVYSLGGLLYRMLCLRDPVIAANEDQLLEAVLTNNIRPLAELTKEQFSHCPGSHIPEPLAQIATAALSQAPEDRPESVAELQRMLSAVETPGTPGESNLWKQVSGWGSLWQRRKES